MMNMASIGHMLKSMKLNANNMSSNMAIRANTEIFLGAKDSGNSTLEDLETSPTLKVIQEDLATFLNNCLAKQDNARISLYMDKIMKQSYTLLCVMQPRHINKLSASETKIYVSLSLPE